MRAHTAVLLIGLLAAPCVAAQADGKDGPTKTPPTFTERVDRFWRWWAKHADRFAAAIEKDGGRSLSDEITAAVRRMHPSLEWVFGPGKDAAGRSLTISPVGSRDLAFLTAYWRARAPKTPGWIYHAARQPNPRVATIAIQLGKRQVQAGDVWLGTNVDVPNQVVHVTAWCDALRGVPKETAMRILFLLLDEAVGERRVTLRLGGIELAEKKPKDAIRLPGLLDYLTKVDRENKWALAKLDDSWAVYRLPKPDKAYPRSDTISGIAAHMHVLGEYLSKRGPIDDPLHGSGARYAYIRIGRDQLPKGKISDQRSDLARAIDKALTAMHGGRTVGEATGAGNIYIDLLLLDGTRSERAVREALVKKGIKVMELVALTRPPKGN